MDRWWKLVIIALLSFCCALLFNIRVQSQTTANSLLQEAQEYYQAGQSTSSLQLLEQVSEKFANKNQTLQHAQLQSLISLAYQKLENWQQAQEFKEPENFVASSEKALAFYSQIITVPDTTISNTSIRRSIK